MIVHFFFLILIKKKVGLILKNMRIKKKYLSEVVKK